jgi:hypothetical protein
MNYVNVSAVTLGLGGNAIVNEPIWGENLRVEATEQTIEHPPFSTSSRMSSAPIRLMKALFDFLSLFSFQQRILQVSNFQQVSSLF